MENVSADREQPLAASAEEVDATSIFDHGGAQRFRLPCAASTPTATPNSQVCPIKDYLPICNELLFDIGMQLREQRGGSLSLVSLNSFAGEAATPLDADLYRAEAFLRWLLRTHVCIASLKLQDGWLMAHSQVILEELSGNSRLRKLKVIFPFAVSIAAVIPRLRHLEELDCFIYPNIAAVVANISALLRNTTCLTSLVITAPSESSQPPKTLIDALAANTTLKHLEMWACYDTTEPPGCLGEYLMSNRLITNLALCGEAIDREELSLDEALVRNSTLSTLKIFRLCGGETTARFFTRILAECTSIRKLTFGGLRDKHASISEDTITRCAEALAQNDTLEELELPYFLWHPQNWIAFFAFLPRNKHLKKLEVSIHDDREIETFLPVLRAWTKADTPGRVSFGSLMPTPEAAYFMRFKAFSALTIGYELEPSVRVSALKRLPQSDHFTSMSLSLYQADERLFSSLAKYVRATTALRKLGLCIGTSSECTAYSTCWTLLLESISANTSITVLSISGDGNFEFEDRLAATIGLSRYTACTLEKVSRHPGLIIELAKKKGIAVGEVTRMIRSRLQSVQGLHDFMRFTGVVKERVTCASPVDGCSMQLEDLNNDCWRLLRRYLSIDDVRRFTVGKAGQLHD
ncbi:hypothetical protein MTO96_041710 [Rhipicephalus appendiculatus]